MQSKKLPWREEEMILGVNISSEAKPCYSETSKTISDFPDLQIPEEEPPALPQSTTSERPGNED